MGGCDFKVSEQGFKMQIEIKECGVFITHQRYEAMGFGGAEGTNKTVKMLLFTLVASVA
jgi:hypothetical protein